MFPSSINLLLYFKQTEVKYMTLQQRCITPSSPIHKSRSNVLAFWVNYSHNSAMIEQDTQKQKRNRSKKWTYEKKKTSLCLWNESIALVVWLGSESWSQHVQLCEKASSSVHNVHSMPCCIKFIQWYILALLSVCRGASWGVVSVSNTGLLCVRANMSKGTSDTGRRLSRSVHWLLINSSISKKRQYSSWFATTFLSLKQKSLLGKSLTVLVRWL